MDIMQHSWGHGVNTWFYLMCYMLLLNKYLHQYYIESNPLFYTTTVFHKPHFLWFFQLIFPNIVASFCVSSFDVVCIDECFLSLLCCIILHNQNFFGKTIVFVYFLSPKFAIVCCSVNVFPLYQDTTILVNMFDEIPRNKANLININTVNIPPNCKCSLPLSCIFNRFWIMQQQKMGLSQTKLVLMMTFYSDHRYAKWVYHKMKRKVEQILQAHNNVIVWSRAIHLMFFAWMGWITNFNANDIGVKASWICLHFFLQQSLQ